MHADRCWESDAVKEVLSFTKKEAAMIAQTLAHIRMKAPTVSWYLVAERLHPIGKTCFLGYQ